MIPPTEWNAIALAKLSNVFGDRAGRDLMKEILLELGIGELRSATDLRCFAKALSTRAGFATAVGGLLALHATMYERH